MLCLALPMGSSPLEVLSSPCSLYDDPRHLNLSVWIALQAPENQVVYCLNGSSYKNDLGLDSGPQVDMYDKMVYNIKSQG